MIITLGLIAVGLVAAIQTIVDAIAHLHVTVTTNGLAKTLTMTAFMFAGKLIRVVAEKERKDKVRKGCKCEYKVQLVTRNYPDHRRHRQTVYTVHCRNRTQRTCCQCKDPTTRPMHLRVHNR